MSTTPKAEYALLSDRHSKRTQPSGLSLLRPSWWASGTCRLEAHIAIPRSLRRTGNSKWKRITYSPSLLEKLPPVGPNSQSKRG